MNCKRFDDWIKDAANGSLNPNREAKLKDHLSNCAGCRRLFAEEQRLFGAIDRALTKCYDREPSPDFAARIRIRLGEECEANRLQAQSVSGMWFPAGAIAISLLVVFLLTISWLNRPASFKRIALTLPRTASAVIPVLDNGPKRISQAQIRAAQTPGPHRLPSVAHFNNRRTTVPERRAPDTQVLVRPGQWAAIVQLSLAAQSEPALRGSPAVETVKQQELVEIKGIEIKPVNVEDVQIEPVVVREVVIDTDF